MSLKIIFWPQQKFLSLCFFYGFEKVYTISLSKHTKDETFVSGPFLFMQNENLGKIVDLQNADLQNADLQNVDLIVKRDHVDFFRGDQIGRIFDQLAIVQFYKN
jgi:hypothetical protein